MKTILSLCLVLALFGCSTTSTGPNVGIMQAAAKSAVFEGTTIWLNGLGTLLPPHPADRDKFVIARDSLAALIAAGTFDQTNLTTILKGLPISQFQGTAGTLIVGEIVILWDQYGQQLLALDKSKVFNVYVLPVAQSILEGLNLALGPDASARLRRIRG